jgi:hypothetical protein
MWVKRWFDVVCFDHIVGDWVGYDNKDFDNPNAKPTPIGVYKKNESKSYSMEDLTYMVENIMKNLRK